MKNRLASACLFITAIGVSWLVGVSVLFSEGAGPLWP